MKASELIAMLEQCVKQEGDLEVYIWEDLTDYPTIVQGVGCLIETTVKDKDGNTHSLPCRFALTNY